LGGIPLVRKRIKLDAVKEAEKIYEGVLDFISVVKRTGSLKIYVDEIRDENLLDPEELESLKIPKGMHKIYVKNEVAQSGKEVVLALGTTADVEPKPIGITPVKVLDQAESVVNPATKEEQAKRWEKASTPNIYNVTCTNADTEYSQALPANTKKFTVKARGGQLKVCFTANQSGNTYILLDDGQSWSEDGLDLSNVTLYFQSPTAGTVAEIVAWT
jgi:hypothetical protein